MDAAAYGGRLVYVLTMLAAAAATILLSYASTFPQMLLAGLGVGLAGGSFAVGVAYISPFFPPQKQGTALGIFGAGNVGAAVTKFLAPFVLLAFGWQAVAQIWAAALVIMAIACSGSRRRMIRPSVPAANAVPHPQSPPGIRASEECPGLAVLALLFLRLRWFRRPITLVAAISRWGLRLRYRHMPA